MRELILNFVNQYNRPFNAELTAEMTAIDLEIVKPILSELLADKTIKLISTTEDIYVRSNRFNPVVCYQQKGGWRFDPAAALALLEIIERGQYTSIRAIGNACGRSRQWAFVYMEALASMGLLGMRDYVYVVLGKDRICDIGKVIKPGILGELRPKLDPEDEEKRAWRAYVKRMNKQQNHLMDMVKDYDQMNTRERNKAKSLLQMQQDIITREAYARWEKNQAKRKKIKNNK